MSSTFQHIGSISEELHNHSPVARSLVRALSTPNPSLDDLMSTFLSFLPELATTSYVTNNYDPSAAILAATVVGYFFNPLSSRPTYDPILVEHLEVVAPVVIPLLLRTLQCSFVDPDRQHEQSSEDFMVLLTLSTLLQHEIGLVHFAEAEPYMLMPQIKSIILMLIKVSASTSPNPLALHLTKIIQALTEYAPTRRPLEQAVASIPCSFFLTGLRRLNAAVSELGNPTFFCLPDSLLANMCGIGALCVVRPKLRSYLFGKGLITALCSLLAYAIIDQPRHVDPEEWPVEKYGAYHFVLAISDELHLLFKDEVDSPSPLLEALDFRLFESIHCALHYFGRSPLTPCGRMPFLLGYIWQWAMKSRRVAHKVLVELNDFRSHMGSWYKLPQMPSENALTVAWHVFVANSGSLVL